MLIKSMDVSMEKRLLQKEGPRNWSFIDIFAGCGGLSLGLMNAGWRALFAIEQTPDAFKTLCHNLVEDRDHNRGKPRFDWPDWLKTQPFEIGQFLCKKKAHLASLRGKVHLVAGGPPCQGFSFAGRRKGKDPRNELFKQHLKLVDIIKPDLVLLENVQGIEVAIGSGKEMARRRGRPRKSYAARIRASLEKHGYEVQQSLVRAVDFGVPQLRPRYFSLGIRRELLAGGNLPGFYQMLYEARDVFLARKGLPLDRPVSVHEAISDLQTSGKAIVPCTDKNSPPGFMEIIYEGPQSCYQKLMHGDLNGRPINSLRLVNHRPETVERFKSILATCRKGVQLSEKDRSRLGLKKTALVPLAPGLPSHTLTTLPDDLLHYSEPRVHTVREHARLQSFPDWFEFQGKYTTGGNRRTRECPRYTQVGNAVPPLLAEVIGTTLIDLIKRLHNNKNQGYRPNKEQEKSYTPYQDHQVKS